MASNATIPHASERALVIAIALASTLAPLNSTMIAVALPGILEEFGASFSSAGWLVTAYLIVMAALQPATGKLGDRIGRRWLILGGLAYFGLASLGAALSGNLPTLLFFRLQQAIAAAVALPNAVAVIRVLLPPERRASGYGVIGAATSLAAAAGPPLGGLLVGIAGWRAMFYLNLPLIAAALLLGWPVIRAPGERSSKQSFDLGGAILLPMVLGGIAGLLTRSGHRESDTFALGGLVLLVLIALLVWRELRHPDPVLQLRFFGRRAFAAASGAIALSNLAMYSTLLTVPILLSDQAGWSRLQIGLAMAALSVPMVFVAPLGGRLADRLGRRWPVVGGLSLLTLGLLTLGLAGDTFAAPALLSGLGVAGVGLGISSAGLQTSAVESVSVREAGAAAGVFSSSRYLGSIVGSSLLSVLLHTTDSGALARVFGLVVGAALLSALVSLGLRDRPAY